MKGRGFVFSGDTETDDLDDDTWLDDLDDEPWPDDDLDDEPWPGDEPCIAAQLEIQAACRQAMWSRPLAPGAALSARASLALSVAMCVPDEARADRQAEAQAQARPAHQAEPQARPAHQAEPQARPAHQAEPRTTRRNAPPANLLEALRRLLDCNRNELAARLGVSRQTLHRWERGQIPGPGRARVAELMRATLAAAQAD
jgi:DNA-binding XRE family transcriptional regulator